jgi:aminoglycoside phosphotransferase (APT) family kinase protein
MLSDEPAALIRLVGLDLWVRENLDRLTKIAVTSGQAFEGSTLLHSDIRADNILLTDEGVYFVDWPHATVGAAWLDLLYFLPSVAMQGGPDPQATFWSHPVANGARGDTVRSVLAGMAGFFIYGATQPPPPGLPTVRRFQLAQGIEAVRWLRQMLR